MDSKSLIEIWEENMRKLKENDRKAKEKGTLVGRFIEEPYADGAAIYRIIRENKNTVRIKVVVDIGDDWIIPYWGKEATIDKSYVLSKLAFRDRLHEMFAKK